MNWHRLRKWRKSLRQLYRSIFVQLIFKYCNIHKEYNLIHTFMDSMFACQMWTSRLYQLSADGITLMYRCTAGYYTTVHIVSVDVEWEWTGRVTSVPRALVFAHETQYTPYKFCCIQPHTDILTVFTFYEYTSRSSTGSSARPSQPPDCHYHCLQTFIFPSSLEKMRRLLS